MPYAVVLFTETNEVEVIPMSWLSVDQKIAFWPPYKQAEKAKAAVQNVTEPDETWGEFFVQVFKTYGKKYVEKTDDLSEKFSVNQLTALFLVT